MSTVSKDQSIITQVAAKIAADLTPKTDDLMTNITNWVIAFDATTDALLSVHGMTKSEPAVTTERILEVFEGSTVVTTTPEMYVEATQPASAPTWAKEAVSAPAGGFQVRIKGQQHGPIPAWLHKECAAKGVSEVWDNRDGLSANPKRPWFKAVEGGAGFWEPRAKR
jgi:hypothetical protein